MPKHLNQAQNLKCKNCHINSVDDALNGAAMATANSSFANVNANEFGSSNAQPLLNASEQAANLGKHDKTAFINRPDEHMVNVFLVPRVDSTCDRKIFRDLRKISDNQI